MNQFEDYDVLITGGTRGIGLACVERFLRLGASVFATYAWGDEVETVEAQFAEYKDRLHLIHADAGQEKDTDALMQAISKVAKKIDVLVSNVAMAGEFQGTYSFKELRSAIKYSAWPLLAYLDSIKLTFQWDPKYAVAVSSVGTVTYCKDYDYVAAAKAVMETMVKHIATRSRMKINCVMPNLVDTESFERFFGSEFKEFMLAYASNLWVTPAEVADVIYSLCSGSMDAVSGQIIRIDHGQMFSDNGFKWYRLLKEHFAGESESKLAH